MEPRQQPGQLTTLTDQLVGAMARGDLDSAWRAVGVLRELVAKDQIGRTLNSAISQLDIGVLRAIDRLLTRLDRSDAGELHELVVHALRHTRVPTPEL